MKLSIRDGFATLLLAAILVPYVGFLANGSMPFIKDPPGMAATALILGAAAFLFGGRFTADTVLGVTELALVLVTLGIGVAAVFAAETAAAFQLLHHAGIIRAGPVPSH